MRYLDILEGINYWGTLRKPPGKTRSGYVNSLLSQHDNKNISAVMGVRRSGKSTILQQTLWQLIQTKNVKPENTLYVNFEDPRLVELLVESRLFSLIEEFNQIADNRSRLYLVLDEIQNVQKWEAQVRTIMERERKLKIYITGSSASLLGKELGSKLTGRSLSTEVFPLSYREYTDITKKKDIKQFIKRGGFPDPLLTSSQEVGNLLLRDYYDSILLKDISTRYNIRNEFQLRRLASFLFANISNQASSYRLSRDLGLSADTILQYFSYIEDAYLGFFIPQYAHSLRKQEYNPKKFYAIDTGLQSVVSSKVLDDIGKLFENTVLLELRRHFPNIYYWEEDKEIDFVVKQGEKIKLLVNACAYISNKKTRQREIDSLMAGMHELNKKESFLVTLQGEKETIRTEAGRIQIMPVADFVNYLTSHCSPRIS